ncbi:unannotated protein [freshwater metagenome]|uniref:Unannotated protein n=1 Tax=freshwater metagenome TaxID=449393 RepID=A0A6J6CF96_9ZZZZ|nr:hypothetical protein [Actinomycetota bacterium]MTB01861.1 hypothetical protein [Actinomycetota bacterium]
MSEAELDALRQEIAQLRDELHELRPATAISRRHALRSAGVVAAGALAGGIATIASAGPAAAASGNFTGDPAVTADAATGSGVAATSVSGSAITASTSSQTSAAIAATNPNWFGVDGTGTIGVVGTATSAGAAGVRGVADSTSSGSGGSFSGPIGATIAGTIITTQLGLSASGPPPSTNRTYTRGALVVDNAGALWYCVTSGTPGTWRQLSGATTAGAYHPVTPGRVYDSRCPQPSPGSLSSRGVRLLSVAAQRDITTGAVTNANFIPTNATAVFANVSVVDTVKAGFLTINPGGVTTINSATITWGTSNQTQSNGVSLTLDNARQITVVAGGPGATDFVIDIFGYWL